MSRQRHNTAVLLGKGMQAKKMCKGSRSLLTCVPLVQILRWHKFVERFSDIRWARAHLDALKNILAHVVVPHHQDAAYASGWGNAQGVGAVDLGGGLEREVRQGLWQLQTGQGGRRGSAVGLC